MNRQIRHWLQKNLPLWREKGWVTEEGEQALRQSYVGSSVAQGPSLTRIVILALGLGLIGLGIFLLFAGYWYSFSPNGRFDWVMVLMIIAILVVGLAIWKAMPGRPFAEGATLFYMLALSSSTFLLADTYYTGESYGLYLLVILVAALPVIYVLHASVSMIFYLCGAILWCFAPYALDVTLNMMAVWILILCALPFYVVSVKHTPSYSVLVWLSWAYVAAVFSVLFLTIESHRAGLELFFVTSLSAITYALGALNRQRGMWTLPFRTIGSLGLIFVVVQGTLLGSWDAQMWEPVGTWEILIALALLGTVGYYGHRLWQHKEYIGVALLGGSPVIGISLLLVSQGITPLAVSIFFDIYAIVVAVALFIRGTVTHRIGYVNGAIISILALIGARFLDPAFTFLERGLSFMLVGTTILVANSIYMWSKWNAHRREANAQRARRRKRMAIEHSVEEEPDEQ